MIGQKVAIRKQILEEIFGRLLNGQDGTSLEAKFLAGKYFIMISDLANSPTKRKTRDKQVSRLLISSDFSSS
jgi:hypothetical protein